MSTYTGHAKKTDVNHESVKVELKAALPEASVHDMSHAGGGFPDLAIGVFGDNFLVEIKDPTKPPSRRRLTNAQVGFHTNWQGTVWVCHSAAEILANISRFYAKGARA